MLNRRELLSLLGTVAGLVLSVRKLPGSAASRLSVDNLLSEYPVELPAPLVASYRADVVVTLLGVPIFSRKGVGGAFATLKEAVGGDRKLVSLQFAGGADPARTHGFKYDGSLEEAVLEQGSMRPRAAYFGFVTSSSNEEGLDQARKRVMTEPGRHSAYAAAEGVHVDGCARCEKSAITLPEQPGRDLSSLIREMRDSFRGADRTALELRTSSGSAPTTFLYTVLSAIRSDQPRSRLNYVHNAREYRLEWERTPDPHTGAALAAAGLIAPHSSVMRLSGHVTCLSTRGNSTFRLWLADPSVVPLKIEFQPRPYLRISLETAEAQPNHEAKEVS